MFLILWYNYMNRLISNVSYACLKSSALASSYANGLGS